VIFKIQVPNNGRKKWQHLQNLDRISDVVYTSPRCYKKTRLKNVVPAHFVDMVGRIHKYMPPAEANKEADTAS